MDFFEHQDKAHRHTLVLVFYLVIVLILIIGAVYFVTMAVFHVYAKNGVSWYSVDLLLWVCGMVLSIVFLGTLHKIISLRSGGGSIARMLRGESVDPGTHDLAERRLLNVVEEMAIASGTPVPAVYLLRKERGINAFAAGFTPSDAVVGVTQGCLDTLTRDELQGVIAHEFSHILNGDMRLNIRLIGIVHGILVIGILGTHLMRGGTSEGPKKGGPVVPLVLLGLGLFVVGYIGVFFSKLIKAAVSRQREFLADASAVQFTRSDWGLIGALRKTGGALTGSFVRHADAEQASHLFFGNAVAGVWMHALATHPPLDKRIRRIDPGFDGFFPEVHVPFEQRTAGDLGEIAAAASIRRARRVRRVKMIGTINRIGRPDRDHLEYAAELKASIPSEVVDAAHDSVGATAIVYALLLDRKRDVRVTQLRTLKQDVDPAVLQEIRRLAAPVMRLPTACRLPLMDLTLSALRQLSNTQYHNFQATVKHLMKADQRISLFEYVLQRLLLRHLAPCFTNVRQGTIRFYAIKPLVPDIEALVSALAYMGHDKVEQAAEAVDLAREQLGLDISLSARKETRLKIIDRALNRLVQANPAIKRRVLAACVVCLGADGVASLKEAELLRAIADALDCPLPPFLPGEEV
jgi:Zn-dependent protease with chaperone function